MKESTQKSIMEWYNKPKYLYNELGQEELVDYSFDPPSVIMSNYLSFRALNGKKPTKTELKELDDCYEFLYKYRSYISTTILNVEKLMETSPFTKEYNNKSQFEKSLSVYNSYLQLEKLVPGEGKRAIEKYYNKINNA